MPAIARWPGVTLAGSITHTLASTMDIFPTILAAANAQSALPSGYEVDGKDLAPLLRNPAAPTAHKVLLMYCGFHPIAAKVFGRYKLFWATQRWHTFDAANFSICTQCCNGVVPAGKIFFGVNATQMCQCDGNALTWHLSQPVVFDLDADPMEKVPLNATNWPSSAHPITYQDVWSTANATREAMLAQIDPKPEPGGGGTCTAGLPQVSRQPCCPGCHKPLFGGDHKCVHDDDHSRVCTCQFSGASVDA